MYTYTSICIRMLLYINTQRVNVFLRTHTHIHDTDLRVYTCARVHARMTPVCVDAHKRNVKQMASATKARNNARSEQFDNRRRTPTK
jgi:hypothetical protein